MTEEKIPAELFRWLTAGSFRSLTHYGTGEMALWIAEDNGGHPGKRFHSRELAELLEQLKVPDATHRR